MMGSMIHIDIFFTSFRQAARLTVFESKPKPCSLCLGLKEKREGD